MTREELAQDLAYVRTLAEEGAQTPLTGGSFLILFGGLLGVCYFAHWAALTSLFGPAPEWAFGLIWMIYGIAAAVGFTLILIRVRALPGRASVANRVDRMVWRGVGTALGAVVIGCIGRQIMDEDYYAANGIMCAAFALFGVALGTTGIISGQLWLNRFAYLAFATSVVLWMFINEPWAYLLASAASVIVLLLPGVLMVRREPSPVV